MKSADAITATIIVAGGTVTGAIAIIATGAIARTTTAVTAITMVVTPIVIIAVRA